MLTTIMNKHTLEVDVIWENLKLSIHNQAESNSNIRP